MVELVAIVDLRIPEQESTALEYYLLFHTHALKVKVKKTFVLYSLEEPY